MSQLSPSPASSPLTPLTFLQLSHVNIKNLISMMCDFLNFTLWKTVIIPFFESHGVLSYIDGSSLCPPPFVSVTGTSVAPNPAYFDWKRIDAVVLSWIQATVSLDVLRALPQPGVSFTSREAWVKIDAIFSSQNQSQGDSTHF
ncbi:hypothetical protein LIER_31800 [Lithospermum erythrorhizon]|uniref:Uncharacterized protein n=1 Tax=Lithospermum erythrorhizon TaxID=34254 RepID=A0AAV3RVU3_LITER